MSTDTDTPTPSVNMLHLDAEPESGGCACGGQCGCGGHDAKTDDAGSASEAFTPSACGHSKFAPRDAE